MNQWTKLFITLAAGLLLVIVILLVMILKFDDSECKNTLFQEYRSPGNQYKAVVFERNCGDENRYSTQVTLLKADEKLTSEAGNLLILDGRASMVAPELYWNLANELWIYHQISGNEYRLEKSWPQNPEMRIRYVREKSE